jgi:hypothetical protein
MKVNFRTLTGAMLFAAGCLQIADIYSGVDFYESGIIIVTALYGISINYLSVKTNNRKTLLFSVFVFLVSVLMFSLNHYNIRLSAGVIIFSGLFSITSFLLILYIDNPEEKSFLYGFIAGAFTTAAAYYIQQFPLAHNLFVKAVGYTIKILPAVLIAGGVGLFLKRNRYD